MRFFLSVPLTLSFKYQFETHYKKDNSFYRPSCMYQLGPFSGSSHMCRVCWRMVCWGAITIFDSIFVFIYLCIHVSNLLWVLYSSATFDLVVVSIFYLKVVLVTVFICCIHLSISFGLVVVVFLFICFNCWVHLSISIGCCVY